MSPIYTTCCTRTDYNWFPTCSTKEAKSPTKTTGETTLTFKPLTLNDIPQVRTLLEKAGTRTCDYTVGGLFMWIDYFSYSYCIYEDTLFVKGFCENHPGVVAFSLPIGKLPLGRAVELLREYCTANDLGLNFSAIPEDRIDSLASIAGGRIESLDDWSDYIYHIDSLSTLSGKALSKKRNHVNRFETENPDYVFEPVCEENLPEVAMFYYGQRLANKLDVLMAMYERQECFKVLDNFRLYGFEGAALRGLAGEIVAFTLGEVIGDTLYVHIEKMNHRVNGAGETINKLFAASMAKKYPNLKYVNREEDMGDPGLRYAKMSYHPAMTLAKYNLLEDF